VLPDDKKAGFWELFCRELKLKRSEMLAMKTEITESNYDSLAPVSRQTISLGHTHSPVAMDFASNPNFLIEIEELQGVVGLSSAVQAGILVNQDHSCWITNMGRSGSTEVYNPNNGKHRKLTFNQVAYVRHGDWVGFYGSFFRVLFGFSSIQLKPVSQEEMKKIG
jgi:hypothetical protein